MEFSSERFADCARLACSGPRAAKRSSASRRERHTRICKGLPVSRW
jgi:hypothetical protein